MLQKHRVFRSPMAILGMLVLMGLGAADAATTPRNPSNGRQSYSGSNMSCLIANDFYAVHFSAVQEGRNKGEMTDFEKYCQEVPKIGKVYLTLDLLDRDVRAMPIALSVVEEEMNAEGRPSSIKGTLSEVSPQIYKNGIADTHVEITHPGHYALIATFGDGPIMEDDRLRIPFSVGLPPPTDYGKSLGWITGGVAALFFGVMALIGLRTVLAYRKRRERAPEPIGAANPEIG